MTNHPFVATPAKGKCSSCGKSRTNKIHNQEAPRSCWGCGEDYASRWEISDLAPIDMIDGVPRFTTKLTEYFICPDCIEEAQISEQ